MYTIVPYDHKYIDNVARLYEQVYSVKPWENATALEVSRSVIIEHTLRDTYLGLIALDEQDDVVGFVWGYDTPKNANIIRIVTKRMGAEWVEDTFLVEAFGVHFEHANTELTATLQQALIQTVQAQDFARLRIRIDTPRMDNLPSILQDKGWQELGALAHVKWMGYNI